MTNDDQPIYQEDIDRGLADGTILLAQREEDGSQTITLAASMKKMWILIKVPETTPPLT